MTGRFIVFEGGEGSGKSTQARHLVAQLEAAGRKVTLTREPGGTVVGAQIRALLLDSPPGSLPPKAEAALFLADRAAHVAQVVRPALDRGDVVVSDRYADSSSVYQGAGRGLGMFHLANLSRWATDQLAPDLVVLLDIDPRAGLARAGRRGAADRIEQETLDFHDRVRAGFLQLAALGENHRKHLGGTTRYLVLDATGPEEELAHAVSAAVAELLDPNGEHPCLTS